VRVLAAGGSTMSKRFLGNWGSESHKGERVYKDKGTGLGVRGRQHIAVSGV